MSGKRLEKNCLVIFLLLFTLLSGKGEAQYMSPLMKAIVHDVGQTLGGEEDPDGLSYLSLINYFDPAGKENEGWIYEYRQEGLQIEVALSYWQSAQDLENWWISSQGPGEPTKGFPERNYNGYPLLLEWVTTSFDWQARGTFHMMVDKFYFKVGPVTMDAPYDSLVIEQELQRQLQVFYNRAIDTWDLLTVTSLIVLSTTPQHKETGVLPSSTIKIALSKSVINVDESFMVYYSKDVIEGYTMLSNNNTEIWFFPQGNLPDGRDIYVRLNNSGIIQIEGVPEKPTFHYVDREFATPEEKSEFNNWFNENSYTFTFATEPSEAIVSGKIQDWEGNPIKTKMWWARCAPFYVRDFEYFVSDALGNFSFDAGRTGKVYIFDYWGFTSGFCPFITSVIAPAKDVVLTLIPADIVKHHYWIITGIRGDVQVRDTENDEWFRAEEGMMLDDGNEVKTGANSAVAILGTYYIYDYGQNTSFQIVRGGESEGTIKLLYGVLKAKIIGLFKPKKYKVETENACTGTLGTKYILSTGDQGDTLMVSEGQVEVLPTALPGTQIIVNPGERLTVKGADTHLSQLSSTEIQELDDEFVIMDFTMDAPLYFDFNSIIQSLHWSLDGSGRWAVEDSVYVMDGNQKDTMRYSFLLDDEFCTYSFKVDANKINGSNSGYGILCKSDDSLNNYIKFHVNTNGEYMAEKSVAGVITQQVDWTSSSILQTGFDVWNTLKVDVKTQTIEFYANDNLLTSFDDTELGCGKVGVCAYDDSSSAEPDVVQFDNAELAKIYDDQTTPVEEKSIEISSPKAFCLQQNYPNPFNPETTIEYGMLKSGNIRIDIYDVHGRHVRTLMNTHHQAGNFQIAWDGTNERNLPVATGVYFCRMKANDPSTNSPNKPKQAGQRFVKAIKLALVK